MKQAQAIGQRVLRPDAVDKVTGRARFPGDLTMDRILYMKVLFSAHATPASCRSTRRRRQSYRVSLPF